jgi:hypothetical protein
MSLRRITLPETNVGELLEETVRAFLHGGNPSAMLTRIIAGMGYYEGECSDEGDRKHSDSVSQRLIDLRNKVSEEEGM